MLTGFVILNTGDPGCDCVPALSFWPVLTSSAASALIAEAFLAIDLRQKEHDLRQKENDPGIVGCFLLLLFCTII